MLKVDIHDEPAPDGRTQRVCCIESTGDILDTSSEILKVIGATYTSLRARLPTHADFFRFALKSAMNDPEFWALEEKDAGDGVSILTVMDK